MLDPGTSPLVFVAVRKLLVAYSDDMFARSFFCVGIGWAVANAFTAHIAQRRPIVERVGHQRRIGNQTAQPLTGAVLRRQEQAVVADLAQACSRSSVDVRQVRGKALFDRLVGTKAPYIRSRDRDYSVAHILKLAC